MSKLITKYRNLFYHRFDIRIAATRKTQFKAWAGAIIRNNFLFATEQILINEKTTLYQKINEFPLEENHPLFKELANGFPKGYAIAVDNYSESFTFSKNQTFIFSLYLIGNRVDLYPYFMEAICLMCDRGLGQPQNPFELIDICEVSPENELHLLYKGKEKSAGKLLFPYRLNDYIRREETIGEKLLIDYVTPTILFRKTVKTDTNFSYQDKANGFPSFYQLLRSLLFRAEILHILYVENEKPTTTEDKEQYLFEASQASLLRCDIRKTIVKNTQKKEYRNKMQLIGYVGQLIFEGKLGKYYSLLKFMEGLGVGHETVYGLGRFEVE